MRSKWNSLVVGGCNVFGLALLALSVTAGGSTVRAEDPSTLQSIVFEPLTKIVTGLEQRVAGLEAAMAAFAESFTAKRVVARELCVADDSGAQTCITKAQLDALLRGAIHPIQTGQAPAAIESGATEQTASTEKSVAPDAPVTAVAAETSVIAPPGVPLAVPPLQVREGREGVTADVMPEVAAAIPPEAKPAAAREAGAPVATEATVPSATEPAETFVAADAKPETPVTLESAATREEPAPAGSTESNLAAPELKAAPAEAPHPSERVE